MPITLRLVGLPADHEVHGCEQLLPATGDEGVSGDSQGVGSLLGTLGRKADGLESTDEPVCTSAANLCHADEGGEVPNALHVLEISREGVVPRQLIWSVCEIFVYFELEAGLSIE